jgi:hypothetical protein
MRHKGACWNALLFETFMPAASKSVPRWSSRSAFYLGTVGAAEGSGGIWQFFVAALW